MSSRAQKYRAAIAWIAENDDTEFMHDEDPVAMASVTLAMVADLWSVPIEEAVKHLRKALEPTP